MSEERKRRYLELLMGRDTDHVFPHGEEHEWAQDHIDDLELLLSELECIEVESSRDPVELRERLDRWSGRARRLLARISGEEAALFDSRVNADAAKELVAKDRFLTALRDELRREPEHYYETWRNAPSAISADELNADRNTFRAVAAILPVDGVALRMILHEYNFGESFESGALDDLQRFVHAARSPDMSFRDAALEQAKEKLASAAEGFLASVARNTFQRGAGFRGIPLEWDEDGSGRFARTVRLLNARANEVEKQVLHFVELGQRRCGIRYESGGADEVTTGSKATIGIITALTHEYAAVRAVIDDAADVHFAGGGAGRIYVQGTVPAAGGGVHHVIVALTNMGNNAGAFRTTQMLERFSSIRLVLNVGIAGGVPAAGKDLRIGDVVLADHRGVLQYDMVKEHSDRTEVRSPARPPSAAALEAARHLEAAAMLQGARHLGHLERVIRAMQVQRPSAASAASVPHVPRPDGPRIFIDHVGSANTLLKNRELRDQLGKDWSLAAVDMESSGVADATWNQDRGYFVIRGISDVSDETKSDEWQTYASAGAAAAMRALLETMPALA